MRPSERAPDQLRPITITRHYTKHPEGSVLVCYGDTHVLCTATVEKGVERWLKGQGKGWVTAEYQMLPRSTHQRNPREAVKGKRASRSQEISRLIGRSLRSAVDLKALGENSIYLDCDVIQADGGTRTAAVTGACVALVDALRFMKAEKIIKTDPLHGLVAAVSVGLYKDEPVLDLDYEEDRNASTDMNVVMNAEGGLIEVQATGEESTFTREQLDAMLILAEKGVGDLLNVQRAALKDD